MRLNSILTYSRAGTTSRSSCPAGAKQVGLLNLTNSFKRDKERKCSRVGRRGGEELEELGREKNIIKILKDPDKFRLL